MKILIIGGSNFDINAALTSAPVPADSNPALISSSCGGVGRNVAENLARLGLDVSFMSAVGTDSFSRLIKNSLSDLEVDITHLVQVPGSSGSYLSITDASGELLISACDQSILEALSPSFFESKAEYISSFPLVFLDANLNKECLAQIANNYSGLLFADGVSVSKVKRLNPILSRLHTLKLNLAELSALLGEEIKPEKEMLRNASQHILDMGTERLVVTLGSLGSFMAAENEFIFQRAEKLEPLNVTGAGDAFAAALIFARANKLGNAAALKLGTAAASLALLSPGAVCSSLTEDLLLNRAAEEVM